MKKQLVLTGHDLIKMTQEQVRALSRGDYKNTGLKELEDAKEVWSTYDQLHNTIILEYDNDE